MWKVKVRISDFFGRSLSATDLLLVGGLTALARSTKLSDKNPPPDLILCLVDRDCILFHGISLSLLKS